MPQQRRHDDDLANLTNAPGPAAPGRAPVTAKLAPRPQMVFRVEGEAAASALAAALGPRDPNGVAGGADALVQRAASSSGAPLPGDLKTKFEGSLGADLSGVRVHTGDESAAAAGAVGAKAYTTGNDIHFAQGQYAPSDPFGVHLLAHEVAHTVQQSGGAATTQYKLEVSSPNDAAEVEADRAADAMVSGNAATVTGASGLARKNTTTTPDGAPPSTGPGTIPADASEDHKDDEGNVIKQANGHWYIADDKPKLAFPHAAGGKHELYPINPNASYKAMHAAIKKLLDVQQAQADGIADMKYWFARVYYWVTYFELQAIEGGVYQYPHMKMQEVIGFQSAYTKNLDAWMSGHKADVEAHWKKAFEKAEAQNDTLKPKAEEVFFALVPSMQAHIRFDLPRAIAAAYATHYAGIPGTSLGDFKPDFDAMMPVFGQAQAAITPEIAKASGLGSWDPGTWPKLQSFSPFDVKEERELTWQKTEIVAKGLAAGKTSAQIDADLKAEIKNKQAFGVGGVWGDIAGKTPADGAFSDPVDGFDWAHQPGMKKDRPGPDDEYDDAPPPPPFPNMLMFQYARPYETDSKLEATIRPDQDLAPYKALAEWTTKVRDAEIVIIGRASTEGTDDYNTLLGHRRANMLDAFLRACGLDDDHNKVSMSSDGKTAPASADAEWRHAMIWVSNKGNSKKQHHAVNTHLPSEVDPKAKP